MVRWLARGVVVILTTSLAVVAGAVAGRLTCSESESSEGLLSGLDLWEIDCLQYHVVPGAAIGLVVGLVAGFALALRNLPE